ncbi:cysteine dioxygenase family protein [Brevibacillus fortis]|uniref:cysteine dioxygenase n=1 Tax=Brevibacillus fortis TaxID=2126352 RepID=UPI002E1ED2C4|nr:cysteine dioxygenase family protein [Brevibacillus fortis]
MNLERLEQAFGSLVSPTPAQLRHALVSLSPCMEQLGPYIPEPLDLPYGRKVLFSTPHVEVVLIHLPTDQESIPHNHGDSFGWEWVVSGTLTNMIYVQTNNENEVQRAQTTHVSTGECYFVESGEIHAIRNNGQSPVISVNVYSPPLRNCRQYGLFQPNPSY